MARSMIKPWPASRMITWLIVGLIVLLCLVVQSPSASAATPHFEDSFESGDLTHTANGFEWTNSLNATVSSDIVRSGDHSLRFYYQGSVDPSMTSASQGFDIGSTEKELWLEYWIYFPDGTEGYGARFVDRWPGNSYGRHEIINFYGENLNQKMVGISSMVPSSNYNGDNKYHPVFRNADTGTVLQGQGTEHLDPALTDAWRGEWVQFRMHYKLSENENDGAIQLWVNGDLVMDNPALNAGHPDSTLNFLEKAILMGRSGNGFIEDTYVYIDDFKIYLDDPGFGKIPTASFELEPASSIKAGELLHFIDASYDTDGTVVAWDWNFGDGVTSSDQNPVHTFQDPGLYTVTLQVTNNEGLKSKPYSQIIQVGEEGTGGGNELVLFFDNFESGNLFTNINGYRWEHERSVNVDVSDDIAFTGDYSMRFTYKGKPSGEDSFSEQRFIFGDDLKEVWMSWYQYYPDGTEGLGAKWQHRKDAGPNNNKLLTLGNGNWEEGGDGSFSHYLFEVEPSGDGDSILSMKHRPPGTKIGNYGRQPSGMIQDSTLRGNWVEYVTHLKVPSGYNQPDGVVEFWVNGTKIHDHHDLNTWLVRAGAEDEEYNVFNYGYIMGWANSGFDETSYTYIDDFRVASTPPSTIDPTTIGGEEPEYDAFECNQTDPAWLFCDDFQEDRLDQYYDFYQRWGRFVRKNGKGVENSYGMTSHYGYYEADPLQETFGTWMKAAFGKTPDDAYYKPVSDSSVAERDLYWRFYMKNHTGQETVGAINTGTLANVYGYGPDETPFMQVSIGNPDQTGVLKAQLFTGEFDGNGNPTGISSVPVAELTGTKPVMVPAIDSDWYEIEIHVKLNDAGQSNGVYELWIDGELEMSKYDLNWTGDYTDYGINVIEISNMNNQTGVLGGDDEYRVIDNMIVSRSPIGDVASEEGTQGATLTSSGTTYMAGEDVALTVGVENLESSFTALDVIVNYDPSVLEFETETTGELVALTSSAIESLQANFTIVNAIKEDTGQIRVIMISDQALSGDSSLFKLHGQVKSDAPIGDSTVTLSDFGVSLDGEENLLDVSGASVHFEVALVDKSDLGAAIIYAQSVHDNAVEGSGTGQYPSGTKSVLLSAIQAAITVRDNALATESQVNTATANLNTAVTTFLNSVISAEPADVSALNAAITDAQSKYDRAVEGNKVGQYNTGAKSALQTAIAAAQAIRDQSGVSQSLVDQEVSELNLAIQTFAEQIVTLVEGATKITIRDLSIVAKYLGMTDTDAAWSEIEQADIFGEGEITIRVLAAIAQMILDSWLLE